MVSGMALNCHLIKFNTHTLSKGSNWKAEGSQVGDDTVILTIKIPRMTKWKK